MAQQYCIPLGGQVSAKTGEIAEGTGTSVHIRNSKDSAGSAIIKFYKDGTPQSQYTLEVGESVSIDAGLTLLGKIEIDATNATVDYIILRN